MNSSFDLRQADELVYYEDYDEVIAEFYGEVSTK
jgi:hypothetical protein